MATDMTDDSLNPAIIRNYYFIRTKNGDIRVQFVGVGDRHRMIKQDSGTIRFVREREQGKAYRYGKPLPVDDAVAILMRKSYPTHAQIAAHIQKQIKTL